MKSAKIVGLCSCILLASFIAAGCDPDDIPDDKQYGNTEDGIYTNLNGEKIYFRNSFIPADPRDEEGSDPSTFGNPYLESREEEAMFDMCLKIEDKYNCQIIRKPLGYDSNSDFAAAYATGQAPTDIVCTQYADLLDFYKSDLLVDLNKLETLDASNEEKWGAMRKREATTYKGALYAFPVQGSMYYPITNTYNGALIYNADVYKTFDLDYTPKEMIENKQWTFSGFYELLKSVNTIGDDRPIYSLALWNSLPTCAVYANGGDIMIKDSKGKYRFGYTEPNALRALNWVRDVYMLDSVTFENSDKEFDSGKATFMLRPSQDAIKSKASDVTWVPFPYGPDVEYGTSYSSYFGFHERGTAIINHPNDYERVKMVGFIVDKLFEPTELYGKDGYHTYMERNFFNTHEDYEVYREHGVNMHYDYGKELVKSEIISNLQNALDYGLRDSTNTMEHHMKSIEDLVNTIVAVEMNK